MRELIFALTPVFVRCRALVGVFRFGEAVGTGARQQARYTRTTHTYFPLGMPDPHDVESAARLWVAYVRRGEIGDELGSRFPQRVSNWPAVLRRANAILDACAVERLDD